MSIEPVTPSSNESLVTKLDQALGCLNEKVSGAAQGLLDLKTETKPVDVVVIMTSPSSFPANVCTLTPFG